MYKDVCKRILAVAVAVCMIVTMTEWPVAVKAEAVPSYHIYQYAGEEHAGFTDKDVASAVFMTGQNESGGAEIFAGLSFDVHMNADAKTQDTKARVALYTSPEQGNPESGHFVAASETYGLTEGTNYIEFGAASPKLMRGECFSAILTLEGEGLSFYTDSYEELQRTFTKAEDGTWQDMGELGQAVSLRAVTYDERMAEPQKVSLTERMMRALSADKTEETDVNAVETTELQEELQNSEIVTVIETAGEPSEETETTEETEIIEETETTEEIENNEGIDETETEETEITEEINETEKTETTEEVIETEVIETEENETDELESDTLNLLSNVMVSLDAVTLTLGAGEGKVLNVLQDGSAVTNLTYTWSSSDETIAKVIPNGNGKSASVSGIASGTAVVTVVVKEAGEIVDTLSCNVTVNPNMASFTIEPETIENRTYDGTPQTPQMLVKDGENTLVLGDDYFIEYANNTDATWEGIPATVTITGKSGYSGQVVKNFWIEPKQLMEEDVTVETMTLDDIQGDAALVADKIIVTGVNGTKLTRNTDYTLVLEGDTPTAPGLHTAVITGMRNYAGEIRKNYIIKDSVSNLTIQFMEESYIYTGREIHPEIKVFRADGEELGEDDYDVVYADDCTNAGTDTATVMVTGKGDYYYDSATAQFSIEKKDIANHDNTLIPVDIPKELPIAARPQTESEDAIPVFELTQNGITLERSTDGINGDYTVKAVYPDGETSLTAKTAKLVVTGVGKNYTGSFEMTYQIGMDINEVITGVTLASTANIVYDGTAKEPTVELTTTTTLTDADYYIEYRNNINAGTDTAEVYVRGKGQYGGVVKGAAGDECSLRFSIQKFDVKNLEYSYSKVLTYSPNKKEMIPEVTVKLNGTELGAGRDYEVTLPTDNALVAGGAPELTITGKGDNFTGTHTLPYTLERCPLKETAPFILSMVYDHTYTGAPVDPQIELRYKDTEGNETVLDGTNNKDYQVKYNTNLTDCGTHNISIVGQGNYSGSITTAITISGIEIDRASYEFASGSIDNAAYDGPYPAFLQYTGSKIKPQLTLSYNGKTLVEGDDYTLDYDNNVEMSKTGELAKVIIKGEGNFIGSNTIPFLIYKKLDDCNVSGVKTQTYTGDKITFADLEVKDGLLLGTTLGLDVDYQVVYENNLNHSPDENNLAKVTILPMENLPTQNGCYFGSNTKEFKINKLALDKIGELTCEEIIKVYNGQPVELESGDIKLSYPKQSGLGMIALQEGKDFTIDPDTYNRNNQISGDELASVTVFGADNYEGSTDIQFKIVEKSIKNAVVELAETQYKYTGTAIQPKPVVKDGTETLLEGTHYELDWENNVDAGEATLIVRGIGNYADEQKVPFQILRLDITDTANGTLKVTGIKPSYSFAGIAIEPKPTVEFLRDGATTADVLSLNTDYTVTYGANNRNVGADTATVIIEGKRNYIGRVEKTFSITTKSIEDDDVVMEEIEPQAYTGIQVRPELKITLGDYELKAGEDYTAVYDNNIALGENTAHVLVTGKADNFSGTLEQYFSITKKIQSDDITVYCEGAGQRYTYTGAEIKPEVIVKTTSGQLLQKDVDYTVEYEKNKDVGMASLTVCGKGSYSGKQNPITFEIIPKNIGELNADGQTDVVTKLAADTYMYTGEAIVPEITVTYNTETLEAGKEKDYMVTCQDNVNVGEATVVISANGGNYVGTQMHTFTIEPRQIGSGTAFVNGFGMEEIPAQGYTGAPIWPTPVVYRKNADGTKTPLIYGDNADYTFECFNNTEIGTATIKIIGKGNYAGDVTKTFAIKGGLDGAVISLAGVAADGTIRYEDGTPKGAGYEVTPVPTVTLNGKTLIKDTDYKVSYVDNTSVGTAKAVISGSGNYGGEISQKFTILGDITKVDEVIIEDEPFTGEAIRPNPTIMYHGQALKTDIDYTRSYNDNKAIGTATLTITGNGNYKGSKEITFHIIPSDGMFIVSEIPAQTYCGTQIKPEVTVKYEGNILDKEQYEVSYGTNTDAGRGTVTVTGKAGGSYETVDEVTKEFVINPLNVENLVLTDKDAADSGLTGILPKEYTGEAIVPSVSLAYKSGSKVLYELTANDYTMTPADGYENIAVGEAAVVIKGKEPNIYGERTESFKINQRNIEKDPVSILVSGSDNTYSGIQKCPAVLALNGTKEMKLNEDYFLQYGENVNAGEEAGSVTIVGNGNYTGTVTRKFTISSLGIASESVMVAHIPEQEYKGKEICPPVTVTFTDANGTQQTLTDKDYAVTYLANTAVGTAMAKIEGHGNFGGSRTETFVIQPHNIGASDVTLATIPNQAYTGNELRPEVKLMYGEYPLNFGTDYRVEYKDNVELGTATVTIYGNGNFNGDRTETFKIVNNDISLAEVELLEEGPWVYTGTAICPTEISVKMNGTELEAEAYELDYDDNIDAGTAKIIVKGVGEYGGNNGTTFVIERKNINDEDVLLKGFLSSVAYTGEEVKQDITLTYGELELKEGRDFSVEYDGNLAIGQAKMLIQGNGNYTGTIEKTFEISEKQIFDENLVVKNLSSTYTYDGTPIEPKVELYIGEVQLVKDTDYTIEYKNNLDAGEAQIVITGKGNYSGEREETFQILRKNISSATLSEIGTQIYTGSELHPEVMVSDGATPLVVGRDYDLTYERATDLGTGAAVVMGLKNYKYTKIQQFDIRPGTPTGLAVTGKSDTAISLGWQANGMATGYEVFRAGKDGKFTRIARVHGTTFTDTKLTAGETYSYKVCAFLVTDTNEDYYCDGFTSTVKGSL